MTEPTSRFGFVEFAETWNGRLAMLGFVIGLGTELLTGQGILDSDRSRLNLKHIFKLPGFPIFWGLAFCLASIN